MTEQIYTPPVPTAAPSISDLETVLTLLNDLPTQLKHDVMVPISPAGFLVGRIKHSNEVLVHLGAEYYIKRTCSQAADIITRKIETLKPGDSEVETVSAPAITKEEALARLQRLAEEEEKGESLNSTARISDPVKEIREKVPEGAESAAPQQTSKRVSKFMRERHPE